MISARKKKLKLIRNPMRMIHWASSFSLATSAPPRARHGLYEEIISTEVFIYNYPFCDTDSMFARWSNCVMKS